MDLLNGDPKPWFGELPQKTGTSVPATQLAKAAQGHLNLPQPASYGKSLPTQQTRILAHTTSLVHNTTPTTSTYHSPTKETDVWDWSSPLCFLDFQFIIKSNWCPCAENINQRTRWFSCRNIDKTWILVVDFHCCNNILFILKKMQYQLFHFGLFDFLVWCVDLPHVARPLGAFCGQVCVTL